MATQQGELLTKIARAYDRLRRAEEAVVDAKADLAATREAIALDNAKTEKKQAQKALGWVLDETTQLPLPQMFDGGEIERAVAEPMSRVVVTA